MCGNDWRMNVYYLSDISKPAAATSDDPCGKLVTVLEKSWPCGCFYLLQQLSLFPEVRQGQIETLKRFLNFYAFLDISKSSGDPYFSSDMTCSKSSMKSLLTTASPPNSHSTLGSVLFSVPSMTRIPLTTHPVSSTSDSINLGSGQQVYWSVTSTRDSYFGDNNKTSPSFAEAGDLSKMWINSGRTWT
ncbi:hypothetical protein BC829DRAFT_210843 [Chytridium lagenaria]|nr:hypothetical protein BC829DRAFT_210843 [Chytridium lagenaria]